MDTREAEIFAEVARRTSKSAGKDYYKPFPKEQSDLLRELYEAQLDLPVICSDNVKIYIKDSSPRILLATGYTRVVIGDYGAYIEINPEQINLDVIKYKWPGKPPRPVKYLWMIPKNSKYNTKIYFQQARVSYADYKPNMYYVSPNEVDLEFIPEEQDLIDIIDMLDEEE